MDLERGRKEQFSQTGQPTQTSWFSIFELYTLHALYTVDYQYTHREKQAIAIVDVSKRQNVTCPSICRTLLLLRWCQSAGNNCELHTQYSALQTVCVQTIQYTFKYIVTHCIMYSALFSVHCTPSQ